MEIEIIQLKEFHCIKVKESNAIKEKYINWKRRLKTGRRTQLSWQYFLVNFLSFDEES